MHAAATGSERKRGGGRGKERGGGRAEEARAEEGRSPEGGLEKGGREGASEEEEEGGGWAHIEVSDAGHVPFVERLVEGGDVAEEVLRRERESRLGAWKVRGGGT